MAGFFRPRKRSSSVRRVAKVRVIEGRRGWGIGAKGLRAVARSETALAIRKSISGTYRDIRD